MALLCLAVGCGGEGVGNNQNNNNATPPCGNGVLDPSEECDGDMLGGQDCAGLGYDGGTLSCSGACVFDESQCVSTAVCGDGTAESGEVCDDGNTVDGDGCSADCLSDESCGNGVLDTVTGEQCDDGASNSDAPNATCRTDCAPPRCGDGIWDDLLGEGCDDGALQSHDGCSVTCGIESLSWLQLSTATQPEAVMNHHLVADTARGVLVLFGGSTANGGRTDQTWEHDGTGWMQVSPTGSIPARANGGMAFDSQRGVTVLFGGAPVSGALYGDTWEYDGASWTQVTTATSPPAMFGCRMVFDSQRDVVVLFGGRDDGAQARAETWEYDGIDWTPVTTTTAPPARWSHGMAFDAQRGVTVLFGGTDSGASTFYDDTWEYDGTHWTAVATVNEPSPRHAVAMAFDTQRGVTLLYGGRTTSTPPWFADTWEYDASGWTETSPVTGPLSLDGARVAYLAATRMVWLFGGGDDAWVRQDSTWSYGFR